MNLWGCIALAVAGYVAGMIAAAALRTALYGEPEGDTEWDFFVSGTLLLWWTLMPIYIGVWITRRIEAARARKPATSTWED